MNVDVHRYLLSPSGRSCIICQRHLPAATPITAQTSSVSTPRQNKLAVQSFAAENASLHSLPYTTRAINSLNSEIRGHNGEARESDGSNNNSANTTTGSMFKHKKNSTPNTHTETTASMETITPVISKNTVGYTTLSRCNMIIMREITATMMMHHAT